MVCLSFLFYFILNSLLKLPKLGWDNRGKEISFAEMGSVNAGKQCGRPRLPRARHFQLGASNKDGGKNPQRTKIDVGLHP